jgi:hypothetical protein
VPVGEICGGKGSLIASCRGPAHHGTVMMRRSAYEAAGGYRPEFYFAQDLDLWVRLAELGCHIVVEEPLYEARFDISAISGKYAKEQRLLADIVKKAAAARRAGRSDGPWLSKAKRVRPLGSGRIASRRREAAGAYFIASCLAKTQPEQAAGYLRLAVSRNPLHLKGWAKLLGTLVRK